jgi:hypothetical protein
MGEEEGTVRLNLRLPASLHRKLQERAREHHRSLNSEILGTLSDGLEAARTMLRSRRLLAGARKELLEGMKELHELRDELRRGRAQQGEGGNPPPVSQ